MTTLARAAQDQQPLPLDGLDPGCLRDAVQVAMGSGLLDELSWLSPAAAAAAVYELASAIPESPERAHLERQAHTLLHQGDAHTFATLATYMAAESHQALHELPVRARVTRAIGLPVTDTSSDPLALTLLARPELRREWLSKPSRGSLPDRRLAAQLVERAARETVRRISQGDGGSLRVFQLGAVRSIWQLLLSDREVLVWRHIAAARGLLANAVPEWRAEIEDQLNPHADTTAFRRAAVSLASGVAVDPHWAERHCRVLLRSKVLQEHPGVAGSMIYGLGHAAASDGKLVDDLLYHLVQQEPVGLLDATESLVELRRGHLPPPVGDKAVAFCRAHLDSLARRDSHGDNGHTALCQALARELSDPETRPKTLREQLDEALWAFANEDAATCMPLAQQTLDACFDRLADLERAQSQTATDRQASFLALRDLELTLLETSALKDLLLFEINTEAPSTTLWPFNSLFDRLAAWLLRVEAQPVHTSEQVAHLTLHLRRLRCLLRLVDADSDLADNTIGTRTDRRLRVMRALLGRIRHDVPSPLRRTVCAALARTCDALLRDENCELTDVLGAIADHFEHGDDLRTLAEGSVIADLRRTVLAYAELIDHTTVASATGQRTRHALSQLSALGQSLPVAGTPRVSAMRKVLLTLTADLTAIASSATLPALVRGASRTALARLGQTAFQLARLHAGSRSRLLGHAPLNSPTASEAVERVNAALEQRLEGDEDHVDALLTSACRTFDCELPKAIARLLRLVVYRAARLPTHESQAFSESYSLNGTDESPLPPWLPARRTLGGFYVLHALGHGGVGSVFAVVRAEERQRFGATRLALKVPDYNAEAARTLSEEEFLALFRREAGALLELPSHPNLARFVTFDAGASPKPILVMELIEGPTLEWVLRRGNLTVPEALWLLDGIGAGLEAMHSCGIGHLDVKPSNVILRRTRDAHSFVPSIPVLVDFGLAGRHLRPGCATGAYGAPEIWGLIPPQAAGPDPTAADAYAYACLMFEVLTSSVLVEGDAELAIINAHLIHDGYPAKLLAMRSSAAQLTTLWDLIANGLRQNPGARISVQKLRAGLRALTPRLTHLPWPLGAT